MELLFVEQAWVCMVEAAAYPVSKLQVWSAFCCYYAGHAAALPLPQVEIDRLTRELAARQGVQTRNTELEVRLAVGAACLLLWYSCCVCAACRQCCACLHCRPGAGLRVPCLTWG